MTRKALIIKEIENLDTHLDEILEFIRYIKYKSSHEKPETAIASESSLKKEWLNPNEDKAWEFL